ncbi:MAG TPA: protein kinase [Thermoleophilaceae bacterium]|nr:protein kinase [Thermoleophilaceae bacterium]
MIGTLLNERFRLEEKIGSGGMSTVYRAWDPTLERWVAIKLMHRDISEEPDQLERFRREARAVARLSHPHVVTVIDFGEDEGTPYIVLEYVEGETLKDRIKRMGRLPVAEAVAYGIEIGRALTCAHTAHLVHRDVKPQNVLIDMEGRAKVTDFGIARSLEVDVAGLTADGRVLGTTDYVSPEQAMGKEVTEQSDVYSLGIVMFEMLTGEVPFRAESQVAVAMKHVKEPIPDVQRIRPEASATLASVVEHATAKELVNRYATAEDMTEDLEEVLAIEVARAGEAGSEATTVLRALDSDTKGFVPVRLRNPRRWLLSVLAVLILAAGAVAYFASRTEKGAGPPSTPRPAGLTAVSLGSDAANDYDPEGDDRESPESPQNVLDRNPSTQWDTERYDSGLEGVGKSGVGLFVDAGRPVEARALKVTTSTPGFTAAVYASNEVPDEIGGWKRVAKPTRVDEEQTIRFDDPGRYRRYLLWITKLPEGNKAALQEVNLYR